MMKEREAHTNTDQKQREWRILPLLPLSRGQRYKVHKHNDDIVHQARIPTLLQDPKSAKQLLDCSENNKIHVLISKVYSSLQRNQEFFFFFAEIQCINKECISKFSY